MNHIILIVAIVIISILFGLSFAYWFVSHQIDKTNFVGNYTGNEDTYSHCYTELAAKDEVSRNFDIHTYDQ